MTIEYHKEKRDPQIQWYLSHGKKRWRVRFTISIAGKKHAVKRSDFTALIDAQRYKADAIRRLEAADGVLRDYTLKEYWAVYKDRHVKSGKWKETTAYSNNQIMRDHVLPNWGQHRLDQIKRIPWQDWILEYNEDNRYSKRYMQNINSLVVAVMREAVRDDVITKNNLEEIEVTGKAKTFKGLSHADFKTVMKAADTMTDLEQLFIYLASQGLRRGEITGIHFKSFVDDTVVIDEQLNRFNKPDGLKTNKAYRTIVLPADVLSIKDSAIDASKRLYAQNDKIAGKDDPIFVDEQAKQMTYSRGGEIFKTLSLKSGIHVHAHMMRHAFITFAYDAGFNPRTIADYVGHVDTKMTMEYNTGTVESLKALGAVRLSK